MADLVAVRVRDCACPDGIHGEAGDVVLLTPTLSLDGGLAAEDANSKALAETLVSAGPQPPEGWNDENTERLAVDMAERVRRKLLPVFVRYGAVGWNFEDADGPIPFDVEAILADYGIAQSVVEKADELYREAVTRPLLNRLAERSRRGRTGRSTSQNGSTRKPRKPSSPGTTAATRRLSA